MILKKRYKGIPPSRYRIRSRDSLLCFLSTLFVIQFNFLAIETSRCPRHCSTVIALYFCSLHYIPNSIALIFNLNTSLHSLQIKVKSKIIQKKKITKIQHVLNQVTKIPPNSLHFITDHTINCNRAIKLLIPNFSAQFN